MEYVNKMIVAFFGIVILFSSCTKDEPSSSVFKEAGILLRINANNNADFFNSNLIDLNNIKFYSLDNNNNLVTFNDSNYSFLTDNNGKKVISFLCYKFENNENEKMIIKWNETDLDTLSYGYKRFSNGSESVYNLKFNTATIEPDQYGIFTASKDVDISN
jgi:hypothetical protein